MSLLEEKLKSIFPVRTEEIKKILLDHGDKVVSEVKLAQVLGGLRGVKSLVCDTSEVPPEKGLIIRGIPLKMLVGKIPEEIFWLLLTGELPDSEEVADLQKDLYSRSKVPDYVWNVIDSMPEESHPMALFNTAILVMEFESEFAKRYHEGINKNDYWIPTLEDALNIIAKLPSIAAYVYRKRFGKGGRIDPDPNKDWAANLAYMLGVDDQSGDFEKLMQLYMTLHCDHEGGNVSTFSAATISSGLSDLYYALSGGLNGLAGPLHGLANQECLAWVLETMDKFGGAPAPDQLEKFAWETLQSGKVIPGYGHAVLRITDPRFDALLAFGKEHMADDPVFKTVSRVYDVVPKVLSQVKKIKDPWPNVDAGSGALLYHYGIKELSFFTVLFAVSRSLGIAAQTVVTRAYGLPIIRPKSLPLEKFVDGL